jgi:hypothetical protein
MIENCVAFKGRVAEADERKTGRANSQLRPAVGHAIEKQRLRGPARPRRRRSVWPS